MGPQERVDLDDRRVDALPETDAVYDLGPVRRRAMTTLLLSLMGYLLVLEVSGDHETPVSVPLESS